MGGGGGDRVDEGLKRLLVYVHFLRWVVVIAQVWSSLVVSGCWWVVVELKDITIVFESFQVCLQIILRLIFLFFLFEKIIYSAK